MPITASAHELMRQGPMTAHDYFIHLRKFFPELTTDQIISLCAVAAQDFHTAMLCKKFEELTVTLDKQMDRLVETLQDFDKERI